MKNAGQAEADSVPAGAKQNAYLRIDADWLQLHFKTAVGLFLFAFAAECVLSAIVTRTDMLTTTVGRYILKFIVAPSAVNIALITGAAVVIRLKTVSQTLKTYTVSLLFTAISLVLFTTHNAFTATYYIFAIGLTMTTIYADYRLTGITAAVSLLGMVVSELFIVWDVDKVSIFDSALRMGDFLVSLTILIACAIACMVIIYFIKRKNEAGIQMEKERLLLQQSLQVDELTGIYNRKALHNAMKEMERRPGGDTDILAIADIDKFKEINDHWGHLLGDSCLEEFARILVECCSGAVPFRYGGDEFCLLFHNMDMSQALSICERIRSELSALRLREKPQVKLTVSFGLAAYADGMDSLRLFIHADYALYEAKKTRDAIRIFSENGEYLASVRK